MTIDRRKYLYRIKRLEIKSWLKYLMIEGKSVVDYVLGELASGTDITIDNTVEKKFYKFDIKGNSTQDGTPAPDNEVPIYSAGDNGTISEKIVNKNLAQNIKGYVTSAGKFVSSNDESFYFPVIKGQTYIYQSTGNRTISAIFNSIPVNNQECITGTYYNPFPKNTPFVADETGIMVVYANAGSSQTVIDSFIANIGSSATTYTAHQEQTYTIPCQQPMRSIGTVRDEFVKINGNWFERHNIGNIALDEIEEWFRHSNSRQLYYISILNFNMIKPSENLKVMQGMSNYFIPIAYYKDGVEDIFGTENGMAINVGDNRLYFGAKEISSVTDLASWKEWISTHNVKVQYLLIEPTDLPCTEEQISILENMPKSYNEQTNIYSLDVTPAFLEVQAYVKKEEVIEND